MLEFILGFLVAVVLINWLVKRVADKILAQHQVAATAEVMNLSTKVEIINNEFFLWDSKSGEFLAQVHSLDELKTVITERFKLPCNVQVSGNDEDIKKLLKTN